MDLMTIDFETFYGDQYTLSKINTEAYLRDLRFEVILVGIKINDAPAFWLLPDRASHFFKREVNWANTAVIHHHAHFDAAILAWHYGVSPAMIFDTLSTYAGCRIHIIFSNRGGYAFIDTISVEAKYSNSCTENPQPCPT